MDCNTHMCACTALQHSPSYCFTKGGIHRHDKGGGRKQTEKHALHIQLASFTHAHTHTHTHTHSFSFCPSENGLHRP